MAARLIVRGGTVGTSAGARQAEGSVADGRIGSVRRNEHKQKPGELQW